VGYLYLPALAVVSMASMSLAPLGARAAQRLNVATLKRLFAPPAAGPGSQHAATRTGRLSKPFKPPQSGWPPA
jgi:hypothetical protein